MTDEQTEAQRGQEDRGALPAGDDVLGTHYNSNPVKGQPKPWEKAKGLGVQPEP